MSESGKDVIVTPAMKSALRLLGEGALYPAGFNVWGVGNNHTSKPAAGRFVGAVLIRKLLGIDFVAFNETGGVELTDAGRRAHNNLPEIRRQAAKAKPPRAKRAKRKSGRAKGVTIYEFQHGGKTYSLPTLREVTRQVRAVQAKAWSKNPDAVPTISVKAIVLHQITGENAAKVLKEGLPALISSEELIEFEPVERTGYYRHYLQSKTTP